MPITLSVPADEAPAIMPKITVIGVGGAGGNAVNNMIRSSLRGCDFVVANTDAQALQKSEASRRIQLGATITRGLGAGAKPDIGRSAAEESLEEIMDAISGSNMVFIAAGMGGGTGTGAAPVIARTARENGILTVGVVTKPFHFEGAHRMRIAESGVADLQKYVDTLIIIPNQNLFRVANERTTFADAFKMADDVLHSGVRGVTDLMVMPGLINLDFADVRAVMSEMGKAMMGTGEATGERRSVEAAEAAISNPLLDDVSMKGAKGVLINVTGGMDMTLFEVDEAANRIRDEVDPDANIIFGSTFDESLEGKIRISVVATGIDKIHAQEHAPARTSFTVPAGGPKARAETQAAQAPRPTMQPSQPPAAPAPSPTLHTQSPMSAPQEAQEVQQPTHTGFAQPASPPPGFGQHHQAHAQVGRPFGGQEHAAPKKEGGLFSRIKRTFSDAGSPARVAPQPVAPSPQPSTPPRVRMANAPQPAQAPTFGGRTPVAAGGEGDSEMDVPAFLRRQN
jgi:cell division protein FtsZ